MSKQQCPDFPYFGARYPDATCIDGELWDLDKCDEKGLLWGADVCHPPCPFCQPEEFVQYHVDDGEPDQKVRNYIKQLHKKYGFRPQEKGGNEE